MEAMTDAPDPGLTDLIAAHQAGERWTDFEYPSIFSDKPFVATTVTKMVNCSCGESMPADDHPAHVALVVEQHTNGRITELEASTRESVRVLVMERHRAEKAEATIARVRAVEAEYLDPEDTDIECREDVWRFIRDLRAALEGKS
ncbi:hypothetical protein CHR55_10170 [Rhodococcus qingshengii]|uniref:Uncharacterized protein n=2 Tax=Rhodococcus qingshengii TaxID=334542 RepID=A0A2A5JE34_RHOSG|nr:hypothetical protein CHR55_10170 [Rhodococcus qingshengii]